jgi:hypothetical protein
MTQDNSRAVMHCAHAKIRFGVAMLFALVAAGCHTAPKVRVPVAPGADVRLIDVRPADDRKQYAMKTGFVLGDDSFSPTPPEFIGAHLGKIPELSQRQAQVTLQRFQVSVVGKQPDMNVTSKGSISQPASAAAAGAAVGGALGGVVAAVLRDADWEAGRMDGSTAYVDCELLLLVDGQAFRAKVLQSGPREEASSVVSATVMKALDEVAEMIRSELSRSNDR